MRFRRIAAATAIALIFAVTLAGCGGGGQKKLMSYFPDEEGYSWEYEGTDGYVHRMTLDDIYEDSSTKEVTFTITGEIEGIEEEDDDDVDDVWSAFDLEEEEEEEEEDDWSWSWDDDEDDDEDDWGWGSWWDDEEDTAATAGSTTLELRYEFTKDSVYEDIIDGELALPHKFTRLQVLKTPIKKGTKWTYETPDWTEVEAEIIEVGKDDDKLDYVKVQYTAELYEGTYTETRVYKKGLGLVEFTADNPDGSTFSYSVISW